MRYFLLSILSLLLVFSGCRRDECDNCPPAIDPTDTLVYDPTPVNLNERLPSYLPRMDIPSDNPTTEEGIRFGRHLFYEPLLSADGTQSCGSCHNQAWGFTDNGNAVSVGIDGIAGDRNSMQIINAGLRRSFFWDGRSESLEIQALEPINNPIEMHDTWPNVADKLNEVEEYQVMNFEAFGTITIDSNTVTKAIAQFERSLISGNSKYDRWKMDPIKYPMTPDELAGRQLFFRDREDDGNGNVIISGADCFHCHGDITDFTDNRFHNNGLDIFSKDPGLLAVTGKEEDRGRFKTPTLRNIAVTAPFMHDGRFPNLDSVINFYSEGLQPAPNIDPLMKNVGIGGVRLTDDEKRQLKAFLLTLTDEEFNNNPDYGPPTPVVAGQP